MIRVQFRSPAYGPEATAAWEWLASVAGIDARRAPVEAPAFDSADVVWVHATEPFDPAKMAEYLAGAAPPAGWLLTGTAAALAAPLALGPPPELVSGHWQQDADPGWLPGSLAEPPRLMGHAGFRNHPLFRDLHNGAFTWRPRPGEPYTAASLSWPLVAGTVRVLAAERAGLHLDATRITAWECSGPTGFALCVGAWLAFAAADPRQRLQLERLVLNALHHVARGEAAAAASAAACWPVPGRASRRDPTLLLPHGGVDRPGRISFAATPLRLAGGAPGDPFTLAGRRAFAAGREGQGVDELWIHPLRALSALRVRGAEPVAAEVTALGLERTVRLGAASLDERVLVPHELGALVVEWETSAPVELTVEWHADLRLAWPFPPGALGDLRWRAAEHSFVVHAAGAPDTVCCRFSRAPERWEVTELAGEAPALLVSARLHLAAGESLRLLVAGSSSGDDDLHATLAALRDPLSLGRARTASLRRLLADSFSITSPEPGLDDAISWAKYRLDSCLVATPAVGRSLVAGYGTSAPGGEAGRPGYAWYFARDACWTALACLAAGDFDAAADVIRFLGDRQGPDGKILHECTTSGLSWYDAADATPLYLLLVARYYAWSGEIGFLNSQWEHVESALRFCFGTDRDGDDLVENTGEGHGWIEFGPLGGGDLTGYTAGIWTAALRELAVVAQDIGAAALAADLHGRARRARLALEERFFDPVARRYAFRAWRQGDGWHADYTPTATHAVPLLLGVADVDRSGSWLDDVASDAMSAEWGVRLLPATEPGYDPASYHGGAVWPLFTGWTAWAEYAAGRAPSAYRHLMANAALAFERAKGAFDEALHGTEPRPVGLCPDQAWSAALTLAPLVYGLLGAQADAARGRLRLRPQLPDSWDRFEARLLRVGDAAVTLRYERHQHHHVFRIEQERGAAPLRLVFEPVLPGRGLRHALVDGVPAQLNPTPFAGRMLVPVQLVLDAERVVEIHPE